MFAIRKYVLIQFSNILRSLSGLMWTILCTSDSPQIDSILLTGILKKKTSDLLHADAFHSV